MYITFEIIKGPVSWEAFESAVIRRYFITQNVSINALISSFPISERFSRSIFFIRRNRRT